MSKTAPVRFQTIFLNENLSDDSQVDKLLYWCQRFHTLNMAPKSAGNLSFRTRKGFVITGTGFELKDIKKENLAEVLGIRTEKDSLLVYANGQVVPSKESILHFKIYNLRPKIQAIFHLHDKTTLELADKLNIPVTEKEQPRGSNEQVEEAVKFLISKTGINYFILKNHGLVSLGKNMKEAGKLVESMKRKTEKKSKEVDNDKNT